MRTVPRPTVIRSSRRAAPLDRSITRPPANGPRSLITTRTVRPLSVRVTRTTVPNARRAWAAVRRPGRNGSPEAVGRPANPGPYHEATPVSTGPGLAHATRSNARKAARTGRSEPEGEAGRFAHLVGAPGRLPRDLDLDGRH